LADSNTGRSDTLDTLMNYTHNNLMEGYYAKVVKRSIDTAGQLDGAISGLGATEGELEDIFTNRHGVASISSLPSVARQLLMTAKMIAAKDSLGNEKQLFFTAQGGFDTHQEQGGYDETGATISDRLVEGGLDELLEDLNKALFCFQTAMDHLGLEDQVTLATHSDFNRTLTPNGTDPTTVGSDHAWGGHQIVMGGSVSGRDVYGYYPNLEISDDAASLDVNGAGGRGRWIPTTSVEQFLAPLAKWMGVSEGAQMATIFPNLSRFADPFTTSYNAADPLNNANVDFMDYS